MVRRGLALLLAVLPACAPPAEPVSVVVPRAQAAPPASSARAEGRSCPADMRAHPSSDDPIDDRTSARFLVEARVDALSSVPVSVFPQGFDAKDPSTYQAAENGKAPVSRPIPREAAMKLGASDSEAPIAVYRSLGPPSCVGKPGGHYAVLRPNGLSAPYVEIMRKIEGCAPLSSPDTKDQLVVLARSASPLSGCDYHPAKDVARDRVQFPEGPLQPPLKHEGIGTSPFDVTPFGPPLPCLAPLCLLSFTIRGVELPTGQSLYAVSVSQARPIYGEDACAMYAQGKCSYALSSVLRASPTAAPERFTDEKLEGVFADATGPKFAITSFHKDRMGLTVFRLDEGKPKEVRRFEGDTPHPEDSAFERYSDCPYCGP